MDEGEIIQSQRAGGTMTLSRQISRRLPLFCIGLIFGGCETATEPRLPEAAGIQAAAAAIADRNMQIATLRRATARYHDVTAAMADGFVPLGICEADAQGATGFAYANLDRFDAILDATQPEVLFYESSKGGQLTLVAVELLIPTPLWTGNGAPSFLGQDLIEEEEFGIMGIHLWIWRHNPNGLFASFNPNVSCEGGE
jgi:hypothetical protein